MAVAAAPELVAPAFVVSNAGPGEFTLQVARSVQVMTVARLERRDADGAWVPDPLPDGTPGYLLSESCSATPPPPCRSLSAGETLVPVAWSGDDCALQCGKRCWPEQFRSGVHRLVVSGCAAPHERFEGPAFEMPISSQALARLRVARHVANVRAARVDGRSIKLGPTAAAPGRIAGLKEISGTSQELGPELTAELLQWLRAEAGFNDVVARRCPPGITVGFVFTHQAVSAGGSAQRTDLDVDVGCWALNMIQNGEVLSYSHFDYSYEQLFSILRRVFPNDRELMREIDRQLKVPAPVQSPPVRSRAQ